MPRKSHLARAYRGPVTPLVFFAPEALAAALDRLAALTGSKQAGAELLRAADEYLVRVYRLVKAHPDEPIFDDPTGLAVPAFLAAVEAYLKRSGQWPLRDML